MLAIKKLDEIRVLELGAGGVLGKTPLEFSRMRSVPQTDRLRVLVHPEVLGKDFPWVKEIIINAAVQAEALHCGIDTIEIWARRWLSGEDRSSWAAREACRVVWAEWEARPREDFGRAAGVVSSAVLGDVAAAAAAVSETKQQQQLALVRRVLRRVN